eukprot:399772_1
MSVDEIDIPLHKFTANDICHVISKWVHNDKNYKKHIKKTERIFKSHELGIEKIKILSVADIKCIVKEEMLKFTTQNTLDIMFKRLAEWIKKDHTSSTLTYQNIANILCNHPLNQLIARIKRENIDGQRFIKADPQFIADETGWDDKQVEQIQLIIMKYNTFTREQFIKNMENMNNLLRTNKDIDDDKQAEQITDKIESIVTQFDVETLHYNYKNNKSTNDTQRFNDEIYDMINEIPATNQHNDGLVNHIYTTVAKFFVCSSDKLDVISDSSDLLPHWICSNCGNNNFAKFINSEM